MMTPEEMRARVNKLAKRRYWTLKKLGRCVKCGFRNAEPGHVMCRECAAHEVKMVERTRKKRAADGLCVRCGRNKVAEGRKTCESCSRHESERMHMRHAERTRKGLCWMCGRPLPEGDGHSLCGACRAKKHEDYMRKKEREGAEKVDLQI